MLMIGYVTRDAVNAAVAHAAAMADDFVVCHADSEDGLPNAPAVAMVYDLDHLWPDDYRQVVGELVSSPPARPTVVHSYNLEDDLRDRLLLLGVDVQPQVSEQTFEDLVQRLRGRAAA